MRILYVASECAPFAASGGLGDVMGALPKTVKSLHKDYTVDVILPLYGSMKEEYRVKLQKVTDLEFKLAWRNTGAGVYKIEQDGVNYYFLDNHQYFDRQKLYGELDDCERFAFFSMAVVEYMLKTKNIPDILNANDWQSALSVIYLKTCFRHYSILRGIRTVYTIHNIEYQGKFDPNILWDVCSLDREYYNIVEFDGCINLMKGAITVSDFVSTVSPNYAHELMHDFFAFGLQDIIRDSAFKLAGVINGIDYTYFSPDKGGDIDFAFSKKNVKEGKAKNKKAFLKELGLPYSENTPLAVMITRLASQKGIDLLLRIADELLSNNNIQLVVLGTGDKEYEESLRGLEARHGNMKALLKFDRVLSKRMYASADMFLMPSKSEPCGLAQMISCSYGTVPIVRSVGGLYDSIVPYGEEGANGFRFNNYNAHELLFTIQNAIKVYENKDEWAKLRQTAADSVFSWSNSAEKYVEIYNNLLNW